jgi:hypothetical protein
MSDATTQSRVTVYDQIADIIGSRKQDNETAEEYKKRALREFNAYDEDQFNELPDGVQMWVGTASAVMQNNLAKKRPSALPAMPGLDFTLRRYDIDKPPEPKTPGRRRKSGEDSVTRIFTVLHGVPNPESVKTDDLRKMVEERWPDAQYGNSALKQGTHAFLTARRIFGMDRRQAAE